MDNQVFAILEKRVAEMEKTVFGNKPKVNPNETTISEALLNTHTMIKSALSCRDNIAKVLQRLPELNDFLDPTYPSNDIKVEAKRQYILLLYPELKELGVLLKEYQRVEKFAESDAIANITTLTAKLDSIMANNVNTHLESTLVNKQVLETINNYNKILNTLEMLSMKFDETAAEIEQEMKPKKPLLTE